MPATNIPSAELRPSLLSWIQSADSPDRATLFGVAQAARDLQTSPTRLKALLAEMEAEGLVRRRSGLNGRDLAWGLTGTIRSRCTLADLLGLIAALPRRESAGRRGRRSSGEANAPLNSVSDSQLKDIRSVAVLIAERAPLAAGDPERVSVEYLTRIAVRAGRTVWELEDEVAEWADARAQERAASSGKRWSPAASSENRQKLRTAVRLLLRAATAAGLSTVATGTRQVMRTYAPEWNAYVTRWRARLLRRSGGSNAVAIRVGVQTLALYATRRGELEPRAADWLAILDELESDAKSGRLAPYQLRAARYVWRCTHLLARLRNLPTCHEERISLVPAPAIKRTVASARVLRRSDLDFTEWGDSSGTPFTGLLSGQYGVVRWHWWTVADARLLAVDTSYPERRYEADHPRRRHQKRGALAEASRFNHLKYIAQLAGWATLHDGEDWRLGQDGLLRLLEPERVARYLAWRMPTPEESQNDSPVTGKSADANLLHLLVRVARDLLQFAKHSKDLVVSERLESWIALLERSSRSTSEERDAFRDVCEVDFAWKGGDGRHGMEKLVDLRDMCVAEIERTCRRSVEQQLGALRAWRQLPDTSPDERRIKETALAAMSWRTASWATAARRAVLVQFIRKVPLRERALIALRVDMLVATDASGRPTDLWTPGSAVMVTAPGALTKSAGLYQVSYIASSVAGDPVHEAGAARELLELYFGPGGALDWLHRESGVSRRSRHVFVPNARRGNKGHGQRTPRVVLRFATEGLSTEWGRIVRKYGLALRVDLARLSRVHGGLGIHSVRSLYGRYWGHYQGMLSAAADMLHHGDIEITKERYIGKNPSEITLEVQATRQRADDDLRNELEMLRRENAEFRERIRGAA